MLLINADGYKIKTFNQDFFLFLFTFYIYSQSMKMLIQGILKIHSRNFAEGF